ncbi:MAG: lactate utilization protein [Alphaproteobacteria bacterium]|nr:lactate utilization protein [Alphaproteobacteria bacterium]|tara:strand:- start:512 stop:1198 length:687 start_codon:yes stop_codon:yes gene_type:complete
MSARDAILGRIRDNLQRGELGTDAVEERLTRHEEGIRPERAQLPHAAQVDFFAAMAEEVDVSIARVSTIGDVPGAVADFLTAHNLPARLVAAPDERLETIPWAQKPTLEVRRGSAEESDAVSVTPALAGIAETGTIMAASGPATPTTLNFLPENHVVVLRESEVVGTYEEGWRRLREQSEGPGGETSMPRTVNFITGPSRTADIAMTLYLGAHGPRRLHIILVSDDGE